MKYLDKKEGSIFFIPLFLPSGIKDNLKSYTSHKFDPKLQYAFGRLIKEDISGGDLVEIFKYYGEIPADTKLITDSGLLMNPIHVSMGFNKNRWRFIFECYDYDSNKDSNFGSIVFLLGDENERILWTGGKQERIISVEGKIDELIIYPATKVENWIRSLI